MSKRYPSPEATAPRQPSRASALSAGLVVWLCIAAPVAAADSAQQHPVPPIVQQMSSDYVRSLVGRSDEERVERRRLYQEAFFAAYTSWSPWYRSENAAIDGYAAGKKFMDDNPSFRNEIMSGFGYTHIEVTGTWITGFEVSRFESPASGSERWWALPLPDAHLEVGRGVSDTALSRAGYSSKHARIEGWLSPKGSYGHMNTYHRQLYVASILPDVVEPTDDAASASR